MISAFANEMYLPADLRPRSQETDGSTKMTGKRTADEEEDHPPEISRSKEYDTFTNQQIPLSAQEKTCHSPPRTSTRT
jgi:hypothetical protein